MLLLLMLQRNLSSLKTNSISSLEIVTVPQLSFWMLLSGEEEEISNNNL